MERHPDVVQTYMDFAQSVLTTSPAFFASQPDVCEAVVTLAVQGLEVQERVGLQKSIQLMVSGHICLPLHADNMHADIVRQRVSSGHVLVWRHPGVRAETWKKSCGVHAGRHWRKAAAQQSWLPIRTPVGILAAYVQRPSPLAAAAVGSGEYGCVLMNAGLILSLSLDSRQPACRKSRRIASRRQS